MSNTNDTIAKRVAKAWRAVDAERSPSFDEAWQIANRRYALGRSRYRRIAAAAALVAAVAVGVMLLTPPGDDVTYIEVADLLESTSWSAPSDVLLPEHEFDIYQELPTLLESTQSAGGSLL